MKTVAEIESDLAKAKAAEVEANAKAAAQAEAEKVEQRRKDAVKAEIADAEAGIAHLQEKITSRKALILELQAKL